MPINLINTPEQMLFVFNESTQDFEAVTYLEIRDLNPGQTCYMVLTNYDSESRNMEIHVGILYEKSSIENPLSNQDHDISTGVLANYPSYIFTSTLKFDVNQKVWISIEQDSTTSLSDEYQDGPYSIGYYKKYSSSVTTAKPDRLSDTDLEKLLQSIQKTCEQIEIDRVLTTAPDYEGRFVRDERYSFVYNTLQETKNPLLRTRVLQLVEIWQTDEAFSQFDAQLTALSSDLQKWKQKVNAETAFAFNMQILSGFIAALGIATVAIAFVVLNAASLNLLGTVTVVAGIGAIAAAGHLFFKHKEAKTTPVDTFLETQNSMTL